MHQHKSSPPSSNTATDPQGVSKVVTPAGASAGDGRDVIWIHSDESDKEPNTNVQTLPPLTELRMDGNNRFLCEWKQCSESRGSLHELFVYLP